MERSLLTIFAFFAYFGLLTAATLEYPESMTYDYTNERWLISNVGYPNAQDGMIVYFDKNGNLQNLISGNLKDPKGMAIYKDKLYVTDVTKVAEIDLLTDELVQEYDVTGATSLNDICVGNGDNLYITDMTGNAIFKMDTKTQKFTKLTLKSPINSPNGLLYDASKGSLVVVSYKQNAPIYEVKLSDFSVTVLKTTSYNQFDGIARDRMGNYYISSWGDGQDIPGKVYKYDANFSGTGEIFINNLVGPADIFFNVWSDTLALPDMMETKLIYKWIPSKPDKTVLALPANDATDIPTQTTLSWKHPNGGKIYTLQIAEDAGMTVNMKEFTIQYNVSYQIKDLQTSKKYFWRVKANNTIEDGAWSDVWNFTTTGVQVLPPALTSPADNAVDVSVKPTFAWENTGADDYTIEISKTSDFSVTNAYTVSTNSYTPEADLEFETMYYWHVKSHKASVTSENSATFKFTTEKKIKAPTKANLLDPANQAVDVALKPVLRWSKSQNVQYYRVNIWNDLGFAYSQTIAHDETAVPDMTMQLDSTLEYNTSYSWKVVSINQGLNTESDTYTFTTQTGSWVFDSDNSIFSINPNPAHSILNISNNSGSVIESIEICDLTGRMIMSADQSQVNISGLVQGVYFVRIHTTGQTIIKSFICE
jgi:sugar lactone lactonase YvrE